MDFNQEKQLVEKAKESLEAFDRLYEHYLPRIYGYVLNRSRSKEIAEDVTSQTFIKAMTKIKSFRYKGFSFGSWLYRIAHNTLVDYFRKNPDVKAAEAEEVESDEKADAVASRQERQRIIIEALRKLPRQYQEVLSLKFFEDLTNEEIADILGCKKETLAVKLHRSLKAFEKVVREQDLGKRLNIS
ncbi:MAG: sigma-70 family RNA polymerase sigma factor [Candidatus Dojkabacteria bacterium]|jgi:RNA polymerase sigma-70 factor (ECF subfamily)|nr:sigma-70 family RNA polymerase sigma factor [Candidatus Dojkabacteria bacterium]